MFDISEDLGSALEEICINSDNDVDQPEGIFFKWVSFKCFILKK